MLSVLHFNNQKDLETYKAIISDNSFQSAYNSIEYFDVFCGGLDNLICFLFNINDKTIILPGYLKKINIHEESIESFDFQTPYGYTGIFCSDTIETTEIEKFWEEVRIWLLENNVISEFIRFNLFENYIGFNGNIHNSMLNIKGKIIDEETQWSNFEHKVRKNVKKAVRENLISKIYYKNIDDSVLKDFYNIYIETMKRTNATDFFFYSLESFKNFIDNNKNLCAICNVYHEETAVSSELLLISNNSVFSFLGGTLEAYFDKRPNDFLKFEVINWARLNNFEYYVLGGGYGYEDGIFKYKKTFFPDDVIKYKTGRLIINEQVYYNLVERNNEERLKKGLPELDVNDESFFPLYNKQN